MCGITGYVGGQDALPVLLEGLRNLEYRGYDSSGVALIPAAGGDIQVRKEKGKIRELEGLIARDPVAPASTGVAHTRWATHGAPSRKNAHPHTSADGTIAVVHNGIIENYQALRETLRRKGVVFLSETDTEVIGHLVREYYRGDIAEAVRRAVRDLRGAFAIGVVCAAEPGRLVAARVGSPLIIGLGKGENYIASDVPAILSRTRRVIYLKDGEMAVLTPGGVEVSDFYGKKVSAAVETVTFRMDAARKQGYAHFMLKEIHEQPDVLAQMVAGRLRRGRVTLEGLGLTDNQLRRVARIKIVACGTAYHAGLAGRYLVESLARVPVEVDVSSEFRYRSPIIGKGTLLVAVSQSGETADTLAAARAAKAAGAQLVSICNVIGSSLARESDGVLYTNAGPEIGVASTKAYTAQLMMFVLLALKLAAVHNPAGAGEQRRLARAALAIPGLVRQALRKAREIARTAKGFSHYGCFLYLGRHVNYPTALEGALKLKEISYIPAEGYAAGEMKHGPIALIDEYRAVVCVAPEADTYDKMVSNIQEILSRKGNVIVVATEGDKAIRAHAAAVLTVPATHPMLTPLLTVIPLQLLAYHIAVNRGCDVDQPRNLAKSVTVE